MTTDKHEALLNRINKNLYDVQSSVESAKEDFKKYDIDVEKFLKVIAFYLSNFELLKESKEQPLLTLLDEKLQIILDSYLYLSIYSESNKYSNNIKSSIHLIEKHQDTFFAKTLDKNPKKESTTFTFHIESTFLDSIKIKNYFSLTYIEIQNLKDKKEIYFVGENGDGKTILLQAILLALKKEYSGVVIEHIRDSDMDLSTKVENSIEYSNNLDIKNVFAYGINRNKINYQTFDKYGYGGLFDTSDSQRTTLLKDPFYELGKNYQGDNKLIKEFIKALNKTILMEDLNIFNDGDIDFNELSEGYKSTIIWLYDLVSRLIENQPKVKELAGLKAIVLIDEIDLYLHPKWKYDFVHSLREVFPDIQFIMVTHSMVTVLGASEDAVFFKVYKEEGETKISKPLNGIKNLMANSLSTSPLFNMDTARARDNDNNLDTREDFISSKIHTIIKERTKNKKAIVEEEIIDMINQELDDYLKENNL